MVSFDASKTEFQLATRIARRAVEDYPGSFELQELEMDLIACHLNGCELDLVKLLEAPAFDFAHDIAGITRHLDRTTGQLGDCFLPRCAMPERLPHVEA